MKVCCHCKLLKSIIEFSLCNKNKDKLNYRCKECIKIYYKKYVEINGKKLKEQTKLRISNNRDVYNKLHREYCAKNRVNINKIKQKYRENNRDKLSENGKKYHLKNRDKINKQKSLWGKNNKGRRNAIGAKRHTSKLQRTPSWLTKDHFNLMLKIYEDAHNIKNEVDHIIPLQGKYMSGLHVPWNLRQLCPIKNKSRPRNIKPFYGMEPTE